MSQLQLVEMQFTIIYSDLLEDPYPNLHREGLIKVGPMQTLRIFVGSFLFLPLIYDQTSHPYSVIFLSKSSNKWRSVDSLGCRLKMHIYVFIADKDVTLVCVIKMHFQGALEV